MEVVVDDEEEPPMIIKNPVLEISGVPESYSELVSLNRRTYFASLFRTFAGILMVQS